MPQHFLRLSVAELGEYQAGRHKTKGGTHTPLPYRVRGFRDSRPISGLCAIRKKVVRSSRGFLRSVPLVADMSLNFWFGARDSPPVAGLCAIRKKVVRSSRGLLHSVPLIACMSWNFWFATFCQCWLDIVSGVPH